MSKREQGGGSQNLDNFDFEKWDKIEKQLEAEKSERTIVSFLKEANTLGGVDEMRERLPEDLGKEVGTYELAPSRSYTLNTPGHITFVVSHGGSEDNFGFRGEAQVIFKGDDGVLKLAKIDPFSTQEIAGEFRERIKRHSEIGDGSAVARNSLAKNLTNKLEFILEKSLAELGFKEAGAKRLAMETLCRALEADERSRQKKASAEEHTF